MLKKIMRFVLCALMIIPLASCAAGSPYQKFQTDFIGPFDTLTTITAYAKDSAEFERYAGIIRETMEEYSVYFDIYHDADGVNNLKTVNDQAGIAPVKVNAETIHFLKFCREAYDNTDGAVNVAMGAVLSIWYDYREEGMEDVMHAQLPPQALLTEASHNCDIADMVIDETAHTVFLKRKGMSLDVGAIAKGYTAEIAMARAKEAGMTSALVNAGGNIVSVGMPLDGASEYWRVGVQDPKLSIGDTRNVLDTVFINDAAVVTSGNYQRFYIVDGVAYNHIIDPDTLMPAVRYDGVTVIHADSGMADVLSTALFILPVEEGKALAERFDAKAVWVLPDQSVVTTPGYDEISKNRQ